MIKRLVKQEKGEWPDNFDKYETDEIIIPKGKDFNETFLYLEVYINWFEQKNKILFLRQETGEVFQEYEKNEIEGIRYLGNTCNSSTMLDFLLQFTNLNSDSFIKELKNSRKDGWYVKDVELKHYIIFKDTQIEFLSKNDIWTRNRIGRITNNKYIPIVEKLILKKATLRSQRKYILEFINRQETEDIYSIVTFLKKGTIKFMGIETYTFKEGEYFEDFIRYSRLYFLYNEKYKIIIEYNSIEDNFYLILKKEYRKGIEKLDNNIFLFKNENSEFSRKCYNESAFFEDIIIFKERMESYTYITDDYIIELVIEKNNFPRIKIIDLETSKILEQNEFFKR
ncbi:hypothetical protein EGX98_08295 [Fusobacterium necrophorum]|uniref:Uncharacterized protein n=3 Tax=Fusobacterium necrophorum TaxID=859 RepID=A0AB73BW45_9FUSO|nr:hypothetical protein [Fusobacterium necrophorum]MBQ3437496.1 hypothetical protein [Fusobacterium sp.]AYZ74027.1 hypothetical protein EGX98_08295 [Fusobacterium necrophorum]AZW10094.1 hypothetical protein EO219_11255 [Fusobacterium necrophorum subsp. necrophorum]KDE61736.1 hypothetical protein FUSO5_11095 [Fusobacterium necrophorum BFTR-1]KDE62893.1 hypothetical protein FUSO3_06745 [Fusobacterium necrophorum BL]